MANLNRDVGIRTPSVRDGNCTVHFDGCEEAVLRELRSAEKVAICVAWMRNPVILETLKDLQVPTRICVTGEMRTRLPKVKGIRTWKNDRVPLRMVGPARGRMRPLMHSKFLVAWRLGQPCTVLTGSYNYTKHSNRNIENVVRIANRRIATQYADEAKRLWKAGRV